MHLCVPHDCVKKICNQYFLIATDIRYVEYWVLYGDMDYCTIDLGLTRGSSNTRKLSPLLSWVLMISAFFLNQCVLKCFSFSICSRPLPFYALPLICRINLFCIYLYSLIIVESLSAKNCLGLSPGGVFDVPLLMRLAAESRPTYNLYVDVML